MWRNFFHSPQVSLGWRLENRWCVAWVYSCAATPRDAAAGISEIRERLTMRSPTRPLFVWALWDFIMAGSIRQRICSQDKRR